jgi:hypothetical protein
VLHLFNDIGPSPFILVILLDDIALYLHHSVPFRIVRFVSPCIVSSVCIIDYVSIAFLMKKKWYYTTYYADTILHTMLILYYMLYYMLYHLESVAMVPILRGVILKLVAMVPSDRHGGGVFFLLFFFG